MQRQRGELVPIGDALAGMGGPVKAIREATPQALHHFTRFDQVNQLVSASEADADLGFMARTMALCSLPRTNPGNRKEYVRRNGPYTLVMTSGFDNKLPYGNLPRLLLAWVSTEAVRTQSRELVLGRSLSEFMGKLGMDDLYLWLTYRTFALRAPLRLTWRQVYRQFGAHPDNASDKRTVLNFRRKVLRELKKIKLAWPELNYSTAPGVLILHPSIPAIAPVNQGQLTS